MRYLISCMLQNQNIYWRELIRQMTYLLRAKKLFHKKYFRPHMKVLLNKSCALSYRFKVIQKPSFSSFSSSVNYDHFQRAVKKTQNSSCSNWKNNFTPAKKIVKELRARQLTVRRLQNERTFVTSAEAVPQVLKNREGQQVVEPGNGKESSEQEIELTEVLPSSSNTQLQTKNGTW